MNYCILNCEKEHKEMVHCGHKIKIVPQIVREPDVVVFFKGQLNNKESLCKIFGWDVLTVSNETIVIHLYKKYGIDYTLQILNGQFIFILFDYYYKNETAKLYIVKDTFGLIPLYCELYKNVYTFSSNPSITLSSVFAKCFQFANTYKTDNVVLPPGSYTLFELSSKVSSEWEKQNTVMYYQLPPTVLLPIDSDINIHMYKFMLVKCLDKIIQKIHSGLDTNISTKLLARFWNTDINIHTFAVYPEDIQFSSRNVFLNEDDLGDTMFSFDQNVREQFYKQIYNDFDIQTKYVFYDKEFISFYFSIPLEIRFHYHTELFTI